MKLTQGVCMEEVCTDRGMGRWEGQDRRGVARVLEPIERLRAEWRRHRTRLGSRGGNAAPHHPLGQWSRDLFTERGGFRADGESCLVSPLVQRSPWLRIDRRDINWRSIGEGLVEVRFRVHNDGTTASAPTLAEVRSAPFGAHLDWTPLEVVEVPPIPPGESRLVTLETPYAAPVEGNTRIAEREAQPAGRPDIAVLPQAPGHPLVRWIWTLWRHIQGRGPADAPDTPLPAEPEARQVPLSPSVDSHVRLVPSSPVGLDATPGPPRYWLGNIEVRVLDARARGEDVRAERHVAHERLARPGILNHALLEVGGSSTWRNAEYYSIEARILDGDGQPLPPEEVTRWSWELHACDGSRAYGDGARMFCKKGEPFELRFTPPADTGRCHFELHVTREFTGSVAVVEFDLAMAR